MSKTGAPIAGVRRLIAAAADRSVCVRLGGAVVCAVAASAFAVAGPVVLSRLVDLISRPEAAESRALGLVAVYVGVLLAGRVAEQAQAYAFGTGDQRLQQRLSATSFAHVLRLPLGFHVERKTGGLVQTLTQGLHGARLILTHAVFSVLPIIVQLILIAGVVVGVFDASVWMVLLGGLALYTVVFAAGVKRLQAPTRAVSVAQVEAGGVFSDGLANVEPIKAFGAERALGDRYQDILADAEARWRVFHARRLENGVLTACVFALVMSAVLAMGVRGLVAGQISIGEFVLLNAYVLQVVRPLEMAGFALRDVAQGATFLEALLALLRTPREELEAVRTPSRAALASPCGGASTADPVAALAFDRVSFGYPGRGAVLRDVSFEIPAGGTLAVVGPTGAGKSSLVRLLLRYYPPMSGRILLHGVPIDALSIEGVRATIAVVAQDTVLFNASLRRNVAFARPDASEDEILRALTRAGLGALVAKHGLDTLVGERGLQLSGGERQRVALARAALRDAPILVLDEATSALDAETEHAVWAEMIGAGRERTTLIITHRLAAARLADAILVIEAGRAVERGDHASLIEAGGVYARLWRRQAADADRERAAG